MEEFSKSDLKGWNIPRKIRLEWECMEGSYSHAKTIKMVLVRFQLYPTQLAWD
jgi:hypothetical protein